MTDVASPDRRVATLPNAISLARILAIPVFVVLLARPGTEAAGLLLLLAVVSTDWVDGQIARRTGQVTEVGKLLDPIADRAAIIAALLTLSSRGAFPWWATATILVREVAILVAGLYLLRRGLRIDVRLIGKVATFALMVAIPAVAWGSFGLPLAGAALALGWIAFGIGIVEYYLAAAVYAVDLRAALRGRRPSPGSEAVPDLGG